MSDFTAAIGDGNNPPLASPAVPFLAFDGDGGGVSAGVGAEELSGTGGLC
ncbi:hypothetical protein [Haloarcula nitratireducens]|uniref:Uncharacterized protein n=1 Tax=Haloarcula nitratireducens TaxID=2487749 RepID=A0AAW4PGM9_9EURY|nr:hypothetical protein [Halomicroarcula nitratireducens]MBX0297094.1 hypothetical protein [Halomicroarcula nitratireducens]